MSSTSTSRSTRRRSHALSAGSCGRIWRLIQPVRSRDGINPGLGASATWRDDEDATALSAGSVGQAAARGRRAAFTQYMFDLFRLLGLARASVYGAPRATANDRFC